MSNKNNVNKPRSSKRGGRRAASKVTKVRRSNNLGPPTASNTKTGVAYVKVISKKKANKIARNGTYKKQRQLEEALDQGEVIMKDPEELSKRAQKKAAVAASDQDNRTKEGDMDMDL